MDKLVVSPYLFMNRTIGVATIQLYEKSVHLMSVKIYICVFFL